MLNCYYKVDVPALFIVITESQKVPDDFKSVSVLSHLVNVLIKYVQSGVCENVVIIRIPQTNDVINYLAVWIKDWINLKHDPKLPMPTTFIRGQSEGAQ